MADAFAASNEGLQPTEPSPEVGSSPDQGDTPLEPPSPLFRHTETPVSAEAPTAQEAPAASDEAAEDAPTGEPQPLEAAEPAPAPQPMPAAPAEASESPVAAAAPAEASVASTIEIPALEPGEGGEWELLVAKVRQWLASGQLRELVDTARTPLTLLAYLVVAVLVLQLYAALLDVLEGLPLVPGLLELVGVITVVRFALTRLVRSSDRQQVIAGLRSRWNAFRGQG